MSSEIHALPDLPRGHFERQIREILERVTFTSAQAVTLNGELHGIPTSLVTQDRSEAASYLGDSLSEAIYQQLYCRSGSDRSRREEFGARRRFLSILSQVNAGRTTVEGGWNWIANEANQIVVEKYGVRFYCYDVLEGRDFYVLSNGGLALRVPAEQARLLPGFYLAMGEALEENEDDILTRVYWHVRPDGAQVLLSLISDAFNQMKVPYRVKVVSDPSAYRRADSGVLYFRRRHWPCASSLLARIYDKIEGQLAGSVPLFTKPLAPGLAAAEDPGDGKSFGQSRCDLIGRAIADAAIAGNDNRDALFEDVRASFARADISIERPYLRDPRSNDVYQLLAPITHRPAGVVTRVTRQRAVPTKEELVRAASLIGSDLVSSAVWDENRGVCNWVGREPNSDPREAISKSLFGDLYGGSAGVALMLSRLFRVTMDERYSATALGALRHALRSFGSNQRDSHNSSFYLGTTGLLYVGRCFRTATGDTSLDDDVKGYVDKVGTIQFEHLADFVAGAVGAVPYLLSLGADVPSSEARQTAMRIGEAILETANWKDGHCSWENTYLGSRQGPLAGLAHGASGPTVALLLLFRASGDGRFLEAARGSILHEDTFFRGAHQNWLDARTLDDGLSAQPPERFVSAWCHGAPGIAVGRMVAREVDVEGREEHDRTCRIAFETTRKALALMLEATDSDTSLCHGTSGLVDILYSIASRSAWRIPPEANEWARQMTNKIVAGEEPLSGLPSGGPTPGLMLGRSGVGYMLLRLADPVGVRSVLMPSLDGCLFS
jgi:hypothetical protein